MSRFCPIWCAIIWCKPLRSVLNYLGPVAPCRSNRDGKVRLNHADLRRTGRSYCAPYCKIAESAEITGNAERSESAERQIAERPESAERRRKGLFRAIRPKNRCKSRRLNWWLIGPVQAAPACTHLLTICERVQIVNMQCGYATGLCNRPRRSARADAMRHGIACKALKRLYFAFLWYDSIGIAIQV